MWGLSVDARESVLAAHLALYLQTEALAPDRVATLVVTERTASVLGGGTSHGAGVRGSRVVAPSEARNPTQQ